MANIGIRNLLLSDRGSAPEALFDSLADLSRAISGENARYQSRTAASLLVQIDKGARRCPPEFLQAIEAAMRRRGGTKDAEPTIAKLRVLLQDAFDKALLERVENAPSSARSLLEAARSSKTTFVISPLGAPERRSEKAQDLSSMLVHLVVDGPATNRTVLFSSSRDGYAYWNSLYWKAIEMAGSIDLARAIKACEPGPEEPEPGNDEDQPKNDVDRLLLALDRRGSLRVSIVHPHYCLSPVAIFNVSRPEAMRGFFVYYKENGQVQTHEVPFKYLERWVAFYDDFLMDRLEPKPTRLTWREVRASVTAGW